VPVLYDAGSGSLFPELPGEAVGARLREGADMVLFSGDKLLGGPQAGVVVGRSALVARLRKHPLMRALRPDKLTLAALVATLRLWRDDPGQIPLVRMVREPLSSVEARAHQVASWLRARREGCAVDVVPCEGRMGGGAWPARPIASFAVRVRVARPDELARALRRGARPVVVRVDEGAVLVDLRTVTPDEVVTLRERLDRCIEGAA
jgi:L-seryl-tRNA(Ser) seleniumtransferase